MLLKGTVTSKNNKKRKLLFEYSRKIVLQRSVIVTGRSISLDNLYNSVHS